MTIKTHGRMFTDNTVGITQIDVTDGTQGQALTTDGSGTLSFATVGAGGSVGSSVFVENLGTGNGSTTIFPTTVAMPYEESVLTFIDGVAQPTSAYTITSSGSGVGAGGAFDQVVFSPAPLSGAAVRICHLGIASSVGNNTITGAKISMGGDVAGDILYYNGTDYQRLGIGTAGQHLTTNSGATAPEWTNAGSIVQIVTTQTGALITGTAIIPADDTIPQISEGFEVLSLAITPKSATNRLLITGQIHAYSSTADMTSALFKVGTDDALSVSSAPRITSSGDTAAITTMWNGVSGTTSAITFKIRFGQTATSPNAHINGSDAGGPGREYGGRFSTTMNILEYSV